MSIIKQQIQSVIKSTFISTVASTVVIGGFVASVAKASNDTSSDLGDFSGFSDLGEYIVKTDEPDAMPAMNKKQLKEGIESCYSGESKENLLSVLDDLVSVQDKYKVNAAFMVAITIIESGAGTGWAAIDSSTHNWMSVSYGAAWNGAAGKTYETTLNWCVYSSFNEAIQKFGVYMTESDYYFKQGKYTVEEIATTYCNAEWGDAIKKELDKFYASVSESLPTNVKASGKAIVSRAEKVMQKMMDEGYAYGNGNKVPMKKNLSVNGKQCDCSAFVCWVLYDLGITNAQNDGHQLTTYTMDTNGKGYFPDHGWKKISSYDDLQPGDIVIMSGENNPNGHVQIFAYKKDGKNYFISCGSAPSKHTSVYTTYSTTFYSAWRVPKK